MMNNQQPINALLNDLDIHGFKSIDVSQNHDSDHTATTISENTLIARVITQKQLNMKAFKATILRAWNPTKPVSTNILPSNSMAFIFEEEADLNKVLNSSWTFRDHQLIVAKWPPDKPLFEIDLQKITLWVQAFGIPVHYTNASTAEAIGKALGKLIKADLNNPAQRWRKSLRIQVEMDISHPLQSNILLTFTGGSKSLIELSRDELLSNSFPCKETENGALWEVEGKWVVKGDVDVDIGANPFAEGGEDDEGLDDQAVKVVDIVDTFRLQEQPPFDKKQFIAYIKEYIKLLTAKLEGEKQETFKKTIESATKYLLGKIKELQLGIRGFNIHLKWILGLR
ncbi:hypothetical protein CASFOL_030073 [Castilleja foliolosa]|uniref:TCTP domain-containing protein n=1 Tax=Castilleja foliolosa TaxID=1961234 RepID=A0ABD3CAY0_9LAMI